MVKPKVIAVVGPTASGKTWLGIELALRYNGEIISADSMQIYKGMDIISAKPTTVEMRGVQHHLIDFLDRNVMFSVSDYVKLANKKITEVLSRGHLPIIVGGTGLYVDSLLNNVKFSDAKSDERYRAELYDIAINQGKEVLYNMLIQADPSVAESIHINNLVRIIRALEVIHVTGRKFSELKAESRLDEIRYKSLIIGLTVENRAVLYARIGQRINEMVRMGLVEEARELWYENEEMKTSAKAIGFKELIPYFKNTMSLDECINKIKNETYRYAKRQLTWFKKNKCIEWIKIDTFRQKYEIFERCEKFIEKFHLL